MKSKLFFTKMHALGNHFIIFNKNHIPKGINFSLLAIKIADTYTGIGCDQMIIYDFSDACYEMWIYNQDGSSAELCGNAARCLAKLISLNTGVNDVIIKVHGRELISRVITDTVYINHNISFQKDSYNIVDIDMGSVSFSEPWMPDNTELWSITERYMIDSKEVLCADIGNPHCIIFTNLNLEDKKIVAKNLQESKLFRDGININFASIKNNSIFLSVWERGVNGFTLSCGSGACVTFAAAIKLGFVTSDAEVIFKLGSLFMSQKNDHIFMRGPVTLVATGDFLYE